MSNGIVYGVVGLTQWDKSGLVGSGDSGLPIDAHIGRSGRD